LTIATRSRHPAEVLPRIFDPFFTTKDVGGGRGWLSIVTASSTPRGRIQVDSRPGPEQFRIALPVAALLRLIPAVTNWQACLGGDGGLSK